MNENAIKKIILICVIILLIYVILRSVKSSMYSYTTAIPTSKMVFDKRNVHYFMPQSAAHYNSYKAQFYN